MDSKKEDFDAKYNQIASLLAQLNELKGQIENILQNSPVTDQSVSSVTAYSSQKVEHIKSAIESSMQTLTQTQTSLQSQIQTANQGINSLKQQVADRYTKREVNDKFLGKTATAADSNKLGGLNAGDYRKVADSYAKVQIDKKLEEARKALVDSFINKDRFCAYTNTINLPFGDMNTHAYWRSIKPGFYFSNLSDPGYINKPTNLAHFLVLRHPDSSDVQVLCFQHPTGSALRLMANSSYTSGWQSLSKALGENQTWQDVTSQRQANINYTNNTGSPIQVFIQGFVVQANDTQKLVYIDDKPMFILHGHPGYARRSDISFIVPNGSRYKLGDGSFTCTIQNWAELR